MVDKVVVKAVPFSFVASDMKRPHDGSGEAKLFVRSIADEKELDEFFKFGSDNKSSLQCYMSKDNMLDYMKQVRLEYIYHKFSDYRNANEEIWKQKYNELLALQDDAFKVTLIKFISGRRYYVRSESKEIFSSKMRSLIVPQISNIEFIRVSDNAIEIQLVLNEQLAVKDNETETDIDTDVAELSPEKQAELLKKSRNRLLFGAPGTGKSFKLKEDQEGYFTRPSLYERVTFHPAYSYAQFLGSYKPVSENGTIVYRFVAGPFLRVLLRALSDPANSYLLIIEEINRADVAAVFGDVFQLLDRGKDGASEYPLDVPEDVIRYIDLMAERSEQTGFAAEIDWGRLKAYFKAEGGKLRIPANMYLWATMNSADQGVMPLDTAFKRRWQFEYKSINEDDSKADYRTPDGSYVWQDIRNNINALLQKAGGIPEDRWLGPFFLKEADFADAASFKEIFKSKVLMYLYQDVARFAPADAVFQKPYTSYSELLADFNSDEFAVFAEWPEDSDA